MTETKTEVLNKLVILWDKIDPVRAQHIVVSSGVAATLSETAKFVHCRKMQKFGPLMFVGWYGKDMAIYVDPEMDMDDLRVFDGYGNAIYNLVLEGLTPNDIAA